MSVQRMREILRRRRRASLDAIDDVVEHVGLDVSRILGRDLVLDVTPFLPLDVVALPDQFPHAEAVDGLVPGEEGAVDWQLGRIVAGRVGPCFAEVFGGVADGPFGCVEVPGAWAGLALLVSWWVDGVDFWGVRLFCFFCFLSFGKTEAGEEGEGSSVRSWCHAGDGGGGGGGCDGGCRLLQEVGGS